MNNQFCPGCGTPNTQNAIFCAKCGQKIALAEQAATVAPVLPNTPPVAPPQPQPAVNQYPAQAQYAPPAAQAQYAAANYPRAGFGSRFLASFVDGLISGVPVQIGVALMAAGDIGTIFALAGICWGLYYTFCKDGLGAGQSYGKKMNGLMVVNLLTNQPCSKSNSAIRALILMIPFVGIVECFMVLFTDKGRRLGDKVAETQVIEVKYYQR